jgi:hypothetical protein
MSAKWTEAQIASAHEWHSLVEKGKDEEAGPIQQQLEKELGHDGSYELLEFIEDYRERSKPAPTKRRGVLKPARRSAVSKSSETWRCLGHYPLYEVSSYGRVRSLNRVRPGDWLKPRYRWFKGMCVPSVVLRDSEGRRCERMIGALLIDSGFMKKPGWMKSASSLPTAQ